MENRSIFERRSCVHDHLFLAPGGLQWAHSAQKVHCIPGQSLSLLFCAAWMPDAKDPGNGKWLLEVWGWIEEFIQNLCLPPHSPFLIIRVFTLPKAGCCQPEKMPTVPDPFQFAAHVCLNTGELVLCVLWLWVVGLTANISEECGWHNKLPWTSCASSRPSKICSSDATTGHREWPAFGTKLSLGDTQI